LTIIKAASIIKKILRFLGWWLGLSMLYAMFAVCPFCGRQGCPVGMGGAGLIGGVFALLLQESKIVYQRVKTSIMRIKTVHSKKL
jgi:hypothetical protein